MDAGRRGEWGLSGPSFRQTHIAHAAGLDHVGDSAHRVFDWDAWVKTGRAIDVDVIDVQAFKGK